MAKLLHLLRRVAFVEGISYLVLLGVAMPLKYWGGLPLAVSVVGAVHGVLFVWLMVLLFQAWRGGLGTGLAAVVFVASLLPFGTFVVDPSLRRRQQTAGAR